MSVYSTLAAGSTHVRLQEPGILINIYYPVPKNYTQPGPVSSSLEQPRAFIHRSTQAVWTG